MPSDLQAIVDQQLAAKEEEMRKKNEEKLKELEKQLAASKVPAPGVTPPPVQQAPEATPEPSPAPRQAVPEPAPAPEPQREPEPVRAEEKPPEPEPQPPADNAEATRPRAGELVQEGTGVTPPQLVSFPKPEYPPMARNLRVEGIVVVAVLVDENGQVQDARVEESVRQKVGLNEAALKAARAARYRPATKDGVRVKMWTRLRVPFKL